MLYGFIAAPLRFIGRAIIFPGRACRRPADRRDARHHDLPARYRRQLPERRDRAGGAIPRARRRLAERAAAGARGQGRRAGSPAAANRAPGVGTAPAHAVPARARVTASSRGHNAALCPALRGRCGRGPGPTAGPEGSRLRRAAAPSLAASNPNALPKWFASYANVTEAAPTSSAALEVAATGTTGRRTPGRIGAGAVRIGRRQFHGGDPGRSAAEAILADHLASAAPHALCEGRRADRDRQEGGDRR